MIGLFFWLVVGATSGATALAFLLEWAQALADPDPGAHEGYGLEVTIGVVAAWVCVFSMYRVIRYLGRHGVA